MKMASKKAQSCAIMDTWRRRAGRQVVVGVEVGVRVRGIGEVGRWESKRDEDEDFLLQIQKKLGP